MQNTGGSQSLLQFAILSKQIHLVASIGVILVGSDGTVASATVAMVIEIIGFTIDNLPAVLIGTGTVEILNACFLLNPNTRNQLTLNKGILQLVSQTEVCLRVGSVVTSISGGIEVIPAILYHLPTLLQLTGDCIIGIAVVLNQTGNFCSCTTIRASQNTGMIIILVTVAISSGDCTPVNNRSAAIAVGSAGVAVLGASYRLVNQCNDLMDMPGVNRVIDHGLYAFLAAKGDHFTAGILSIAKQDLIVDRNDRAVAGSKLFLRCNGLSSCMVDTTPGPHTDRQAQKSLFTTQFTILSTGQYDADNVLNRVNIIGGSKCLIITVLVGYNVLDFVTGCDRHALQFPLVRRVQLNISFNVLHILGIVSLNVNVVNRVVFRLFAGIVVASYINQALFFGSLDGKGRRFLSAVTQHIRNLEGDRVLAIGQRNIADSCHDTTSNLGINLHTVQIDLCGFNIQASHIALVAISYIRRERCTGCIDDCVVCSHSSIRTCILDLTNDGLLTVIYSRAVVEGDIIKVEGPGNRVHGLNIEADERGGTAMILGCEGLQCTNIIVRSQVEGSVHPAVSRDIFLSTGIQCLLHTADGGKHEVAAGKGNFSIFRDTCAELRLHCKARCSFGNIDPHTQRCCIQTVGNVTQNTLPAHVHQMVIAPTSKATVLVVQFNAQCILAILDLTIFLGGQESLCSISVRILTSERI